MSQDASTTSVTLGSFEPEPSGSTIVDHYADGLMNELFDDVEHILEEGLELPAEPVHPEPSSHSSLSLPTMTMPPALVSPSGLGLRSPDDFFGGELSTLQAETEQARRRGNRFDFLLLGAAAATILLTVGIWFMNRDYWMPGAQRIAAPPPPPTPEQLAAQADADFLQYLNRSLEVLDRKTEVQRVANSVSIASAPNGANASQVAAGAVPNAATQLPAVPGQTPNVIERIYVPLYQPQATAPATPFQNFALRYANPAPAPVAPTAALPRVPLPAAPVPAAPVPAVPAVPAAPVAPAAPTATAPATVHTLVGILELGDRSAALFDIDGSTQRFFIGEPIGSSGWALVSVNNQEAVIRRNGEVRSVYVGQKF